MRKYFLLVFIGALFLSFAFVLPALALSTSDGLVGYFPFSGNANDASGIGNNGVVYGAQLTSDKNGNQNSAYKFNGNGDYISLPHNSSLYPNVFTVSAWINISEYSSSVNAGSIIYSNYISWNGLFFNITPNGHVGIRIHSGSPNAAETIGGTIVSKNVWRHVAGVYDGVDLSVYVDGKLDGIKTPTFYYSPIIGSANPAIGKPSWASCTQEPACFNGVIDEVRLYSKAFSDAEMEALFLADGGDENKYDYDDNVIHIADKEQGGECFLIGEWNSEEKKCQLNQDVYGKSFNIDDGGIIFDGNGKKIEGATDIKGIIVDGKNKVAINNIVLRGFSSAIYIKDSSEVYIENNKIFGTSIFSKGVEFVRSNNNVITNNSIVGQLHSAIIIGGNNNRVGENNINDINSKGISIIGSSNNVFFNLISNVHNFGVGISTATNYSDNHFYDNTIINCGYGFIMSAIPGYFSSGNEVYHNNFIDNWIGSAGCGGRYGTAGCQDNLFYKDLPEGGNYWSNNNCADIDNNGICDDQYINSFLAKYDTGNYEMRDNYPWYGRDGWKNLYTNNLPELAYSNEEGFENDENPGIEPNRGVADGSEFEFKINYIDADNDAPQYANVFIEKKDEADDLFKSFKESALEQMNPYDTNYIDGAEFYYKMVFPKGEYRFYFQASDGKDQVKLPKDETFLNFSVGYSNIAFLPGIKGSRLYKEDLIFEDQLWETTNSYNIEDLFLNPDGTSKDENIYTRDAIDHAYSFIDKLYKIDVYKGFFDFLENELKNKEIINDWKALPYDWRLDLEYIIDQGVQIKKEDDIIMQLMYLTDEIKNLAATSATGKVSIIAHSNGGLLAKILANRFGNEASEYIDRIILVASPQLGTPEAIEAILHGETQEIRLEDKIIIISSLFTRQLAENMPSGYALLPSKEYFNRVQSPVIKFDSSVGKLDELLNRSNNSISNFDDMYDFLLGDNERREKPIYYDINYPNVANERLLNDAINIHDNLLDFWTAPSGIEVIQIVGWGNDTFKNIRYSCGKNCSSLSSLDRELEFTLEGDGVVVFPSAKAMDVETYYINLFSHNECENKNSEHFDIMGINGVQDLIAGKISNSLDDENLPSYIFKEKFIDSSSRKRIVLKSPVAIDVYDSNNNHIGLSESLIENSDLQFFEAKIPNSYYRESAGHKYAGFGYSSNEDYKIELKGLDLGTFTLEIANVENDVTTEIDKFIDIPVSESTTGVIIVSGGAVNNLNIDINGDGTIDQSIQPSDNPDEKLSLEMLQQIINSLDAHISVKKSLGAQIDKAEKFIEKNKLELADKALDQLKKEIEKLSREKMSDKRQLPATIAEKLTVIIDKIQTNLGYSN